MELNSQDLPAGRQAQRREGAALQEIPFHQPEPPHVGCYDFSNATSTVQVVQVCSLRSGSWPSWLFIQLPPG
jgi:hypothetical protein